MDILQILDGPGGNVLVEYPTPGENQSVVLPSGTTTMYVRVLRDGCSTDGSITPTLVSISSFTFDGTNVVIIPSASSSGLFLQSSVDGSPSPIQAYNPAGISFVNPVVSGSTLDIKIFEDIAGNTLQAQDQKQVPTPAITQSVSPGAGISPVFNLFNSSPDTVANTFSSGNYLQTNDTFAPNFVLGNFTIGFTTYSGITLDLPAGKSTASITPAIIQAALEAQGVSTANAAIFANAGYISGTYGAVNFNFPAAGTAIGLTTVTVQLDVSHNYIDGAQIDSVTQASFAYDHCAAIPDTPPNENCNSYSSISSIDNGNGTQTITITK